MKTKMIPLGLRSSNFVKVQVGYTYTPHDLCNIETGILSCNPKCIRSWFCLLYTSDAADEEDSVDLGGRRII